MKNMMSMMKQAQKLQAKMMEMQAEMGNRTVTAAGRRRHGGGRGQRPPGTAEPAH